MSWIDKIQTDLTITTGDGKTYAPNWLNASKGVEYNVAIFEFYALPGSLVKRGTPRGRKYAIDIMFQGEDHLDVAEAFEISSANPAPWKVAHPFYGNILVQPISLTFGNEEYNISRITGMIVETISENAASASNVSPIEKIHEDKDLVDASLNTTFANDVPNINAVDATKLSGNVSNTYNSVATQIKESLNSDAYFNAYNTAIAAINNPVYDTLTTMQAVRDFITMPYSFADSVIARINMFVLQFDMLSGTVNTLFTRTSKKIYENNAGMSISSMFLAAVTNIGNAFVNATDVYSVIETLLSRYNKFIDDLDAIQSDNGGNPDSYIPDADSITGLSSLAGLTISALLEIAVNGKQQRTLTLEADTNLITVANRVYTYTGDDSIFDQLISTNNIGINELLMLEKGRKIVYYI